MPADETRRPAGRRVLLIEDEPDLERIYADFFRQQGWTVDATNNIAEALRLTADNKPDAVLLDIIIPKPDNTVAEQGWEYLAAVKKNLRLKKTPVIVFTNLDTLADREKSERLGAAGFIFKRDSSPREVLAALEKVIQFARSGRNKK